MTSLSSHCRSILTETLQKTRLSHTVDSHVDPLMLFRVLYETRLVSARYCRYAKETAWQVIATAIINDNRSTQFCRIKGCVGAGCSHPPLPNIFKREKEPRQIIYHFKENFQRELAWIISKLQNFASNFASWSQKSRSGEIEVFLSMKCCEIGIRIR